MPGKAGKNLEGYTIFLLYGLNMVSPLFVPYYPSTQVQLLGDITLSLPAPESKFGGVD